MEHIRIRFWDKVRALELLAKHLGLLDERVQVTIQHEEMVRRLHAGRERARLAALGLPAASEAKEAPIDEMPARLNAVGLELEHLG